MPARRLLTCLGLTASSLPSTKILKKKSEGTTYLQRSEERKGQHFFRPLRERFPEEDKTGGPFWSSRRRATFAWQKSKCRC